MVVIKTLSIVGATSKQQARTQPVHFIHELANATLQGEKGLRFDLFLHEAWPTRRFKMIQPILGKKK